MQTLTKPEIIIPEIEAATGDLIKGITEAITRAKGDVFFEGYGGTKNGYRTRNPRTQVPRDREDMF